MSEPGSALLVLPTPLTLLSLILAAPFDPMSAESVTFYAIISAGNFHWGRAQFEFDMMKKYIQNDFMPSEACKLVNSSWFGTVSPDEVLIRMDESSHWAFPVVIVKVPTEEG